VAELRQIIGAMSMTNLDMDGRTASRLSYAAEVLGAGSFGTAARRSRMLLTYCLAPCHIWNVRLAR
jgi:hypothetical protein